uniref:Klotho beta n=1 Tax=Hucho hucho TaxID=62062 RepID=A0A4W5QPA4_9TELE
MVTYHLSLLLEAFCSLGEGGRQWQQSSTPEPYNQSQSFLNGTFPPGPVSSLTGLPLVSPIWWLWSTIGDCSTGSERGIEPVVTLFHWDLSQALQEHYWGWRNDTLVGLFDMYAAFCFRTYGGRVRYWITMHNPYLGGCPGLTSISLTHLQAHAKAWHTYNTHFHPTQKGQVSLVLGSLCQQSMEAVLGRFANPIFGDGDCPFTPEDKLRVRGTADFFSLSFGPNNLRLGQSLALYGQMVFPDLRRVLGWVRLEYGDLPVLVAEGGWFSDAAVEREDTVAIYLMTRFINQVLVRVFGYTAWSLVDGFQGNYGCRLGLFYVDFSQANRTRVPKTTTQFYRQVVKDNGFPGDERSKGVSHVTSPGAWPTQPYQGMRRGGQDICLMCTLYSAYSMFNAHANIH